VLGDEINRAPPKVQSALLEAMQEKQATIGHNTYILPKPFIVLATQNPLETLGTYPLPEAQIDRFLFKLNVVYPSTEEEIGILDSNITVKALETFDVKEIFDQEQILSMQGLVNEIYVNSRVKNYIVHLVDATRNPAKFKLETAKYVEWGASPRASIGLFVASKAEALLRNSIFVKPDHVKKVVADVFRHRIILNYLAQAEDVTSEDVISEILKKVKIP
jgi:MoxR-like ATPase